MTVKFINQNFFEMFAFFLHFCQFSFKNFFTPLENYCFVTLFILHHPRLSFWHHLCIYAIFSLTQIVRSGIVGREIGVPDWVVSYVVCVKNL